MYRSLGNLSTCVPCSHHQVKTYTSSVLEVCLTCAALTEYMEGNTSEGEFLLGKKDQILQWSRLFSFFLFFINL